MDEKNNLFTLNKVIFFVRALIAIYSFRLLLGLMKVHVFYLQSILNLSISRVEEGKDGHLGFRTFSGQFSIPSIVRSRWVLGHTDILS